MLRELDRKMNEEQKDAYKNDLELYKRAEQTMKNPTIVEITNSHSDPHTSTD